MITLIEQLEAGVALFEFNSFRNNKKPSIYGGNSHWSRSLVVVSISNLLIKLNIRSLLRFMSIIAFKFSDEIFDLLFFTVSPAADHVLSTSPFSSGC